MLEVGVAGQPGDDRGGGGDAGGLDTGGAQGRVLPDDHGAGRVPRGPPVDRHGPHADPMRLQWK